MALLPKRTPWVDLTDRVDVTAASPTVDLTGSSPRPASPSSPSSRESTSFEMAFPTLYRRSLGLARKFLGAGPASEDVAAEAMARALMRWDRLEPQGRPGWVLRVTANLCIDVLRRKGRTPEPGVVDLEDATTLRLTLADALRKLPRRQREAVTLRFLADLSEERTAAAMGISAGSVKTHVHRGLAALRQRLGDAALGDDWQEVTHGSAH